MRRPASLELLLGQQRTLNHIWHGIITSSFPLPGDFRLSREHADDARALGITSGIRRACQRPVGTVFSWRA
jgi:hypothetical protein